jgi:serine/threonine protein kinase
MKYREGNCSGDIDVSKFSLILTQLLALHKDMIVHGDIRLANMLVSSGVLIDFDLAGEQGKATYPLGFQSIRQDGKRHQDIDVRLDPTKFDDEAISTVTLEFNHDYFSMAYVLKLFVVNEPSKQGCWDSAVELVESGKLDDAIDVLNKNDGIHVRLENTKLAKMFGTGVD